MNDIEVRLFCTCGGYRFGWLPTPTAAAIQADWDQQHSGKGHAACTREVCARNRRRIEKYEDEKRRKADTP
jgi:hypothetical protein